MAAAPEQVRDFYLDAKRSVEQDDYSQDLEDELDGLLMEEEGLLQQRSEMEGLLFEQEYEKQRQERRIEVTPSEFTEFAVRIPIEGEIVPFSFEGRRYLRTIYDSPARRKLLIFSRQSEKSCEEHSPVLLANGATVPISAIQVGDRVATLAEDGSHITTGTVTWKSTRYKKPCRRIRMQQNLEATVATTHPLRSWGKWTESGALAVGDRIASVRRAGVFVVTPADTPDPQIIFAAYMIGDGCCGVSNNFNFTQNPGPVLNEFRSLARAQGWPVREGRRNGATVLNLQAGRGSEPRQLLERWGVWGRRSAEHAVPNWVWGLDRRQTALFLNRLWATDGSVKVPCPSHYVLVYASTSHQLVQEVQRLLWKFGIPSRIRGHEPTLYKGTGRSSYILTIQTQDGVVAFLTEIGALGKSEDVPMPSVKQNSNRDTYPLQITDDLRAVARTWSRGRCAHYKAGLHASPVYPLSRRKLQRYVEFYAAGGCDPVLLRRLEAHVDTDLYWDRVVEIEEVGERWCYDITVEGTGNFVLGGLVTHNSTYLGNSSLAYSAIIPAFKTLYVCPTAAQAQVFSVDRLRDPLEISPQLQYMISRELAQNVFFKQFRNRSQIRIRYAFLSADRARGIASDKVQIDEFQDVHGPSVPVIEQCTSHSSYGLFDYAGTPKSLDNSLHKYWIDFSTQNEWAVPCRAHGTPNKPSSWHWNVLGIKNIGKTGPICTRCGKPIDPNDPLAQWVEMQPVTSDNANRVTFAGYHICQLMVPWMLGPKWKEILTCLEQYDAVRFNNEVLGVSYDSGQRPLKRAHVIRCCNDNIDMTKVLETAKRCESGVFAGLDHGSGEEASFSVLTLGGYIDGLFQIFFAHRFTGEDLDPRRQLRRIAKLLLAVDFKILGSDYGGGFDRNDWLMRNFSMSRVARYQYAGSPKKKVAWEPDLGRFILHRTEVMSDFFSAIRNQKVRFPKWSQWEDPYAQDMLNIFAEYNARLHMTQYKLTRGKSDDTFHSMLYCFLASMIMRPRPDILIPMFPGHVEFAPGIAA